jgi:hypothetical protein
MDYGNLGSLLLLFSIILIIIIFLTLFVFSLVNGLFGILKIVIKICIITMFIFLLLSYLWPTAQAENCSLIVSENFAGYNVIHPDKLLLIINPVSGVIGADRAWVLFTYFISLLRSYKCKVVVVNNNVLEVKNFLNGLRYLIKLLVPFCIELIISTLKSLIVYFPKEWK